MLSLVFVRFIGISNVVLKKRNVAEMSFIITIKLDTQSKLYNQNCNPMVFQKKSRSTYETKYSRIDEVKYVENSLTIF